ncbi:MAG: 3-phosphoserine/phosphohydroxythreonine transaminase [Acidobacteria bacterium]|nr:MAG: 3-phosphoserine/phosphohydroxythreonine transaminase [Acidobacteriota bacterium]
METTSDVRPAPRVKRIYNFSPGPAMLPEPVLEQAQEDLWSLGDTGIGILEHSHRGAAFAAVLADAEARCRRLAGLGDEWAVLFLQGGATLQFAMVPMNFLSPGTTADYLHTGAWTRKAIAYARAYGDVHLAFDGESCAFDHVPEPAEIALSAEPVYAWYCSNNTIAGTQYPSPPEVAAPLICDASSDVFGRPLPVAGHAMVIAGAQKNLGPAGCTLVLARRDFLERARRDLPPILDYRQHDAKGSCLNTPPAFAIHVMGLVFRWLEEQGGLEAMARRNAAKAQLIYDAIDRSGGFYRAVARPGSRSSMNVTFRTPSADLDARFADEALAHDMSGLKGHRSVGGLRASIYNAFPPSGCRTLADFMDDFAARHG